MKGRKKSNREVAEEKAQKIGGRNLSRAFQRCQVPLKQITEAYNQDTEITKLLGHHSNQKSNQCRDQCSS